MGEISILHLSDIHFKRDKDDDNKIFRGDVQDKLLKTIERHLRDKVKNLRVQLEEENEGSRIKGEVTLVISPFE